MQNQTHRTGRLFSRTHRTAALLAIYSSVILAISATFAATPSSAPATRPAAARPAPNPAAAQKQFQIAKDLYDKQQYVQAQVENEKALQLDPSNSLALLLRKALEPHLAAGEGTGAGGTAQAGTNVKPGVLTPQQISMIRLIELNPARETAIRGSIDRKTLEDFWNEVVKKDPATTDTSQAAQNAFLRPANFPNQVLRIRDSGDRKYMDKITITSDPADMIVFKNSVNTFVMPNCATSECHGGQKGGSFRLVTADSSHAGATPEQIMYTNFYIMSMYTTKDGAYMIDRGNPEKSAFLQYSLPANASKSPHPGGEIPRHLSDKLFSSMTDWIKTLAFPPQKPNYDITFDLPTGTTSRPN